MTPGDDVPADDRDRWSRPSPSVPGRPLTPAQERALEALLRLCPELGNETTMHEIAAATDLKPAAATQALNGLERRSLAVRHDYGDAWSPTYTGRARAAALERRNRS